MKFLKFLACTLLILAVAAGSFVGGWYANSRLGKKDESAEEQPGADEPAEGQPTGGLEVTPESSTTALSLTAEPIVANDDGTPVAAAEKSYTVTATVSASDWYPGDPSAVAIDWYLVFQNPDSEWAAEKSVTDYIFAEQNEEDNHTVTVSCISETGFAEPMRLVAYLQDRPDVNAECSINFAQKFEIDHILFRNRKNEEDVYGIMYGLDETYNEGTYFVSEFKNETSIETIEIYLKHYEYTIPLYSYEYWRVAINPSTDLQQYIDDNLTSYNEFKYSPLATIKTPQINNNENLKKDKIIIPLDKKVGDTIYNSLLKWTESTDGTNGNNTKLSKIIKGLQTPVKQMNFMFYEYKEGPQFTFEISSSATPGNAYVPWYTVYELPSLTVRWNTEQLTEWYNTLINSAWGVQTSSPSITF